MKNQKVHKGINLEMLAGGAFAEKLNEALLQVAENIQNENTDATAKRGITVNIKFAPNKARNMVHTQIAVTTKLAATEAIETDMLMGTDARTGRVEIAEIEQMQFNDLSQQVEMDEPEQEQEPVTAGKPLDLRNRKKPEALGYDPETGEVYGSSTNSTEKVVELKAAKA